MPPFAFNGTTAYVLQSIGDTARAAKIRKSLDAASDTIWMIHTARAFAHLATDTAKALTEIEAALAAREIFPSWLPFMERIYYPVRNSARFAAVVRGYGLEGTGVTGRYGGRPAR